jgi:hypothetical protein
MTLEKIKNYYLLWGKGYLEAIALVCGGSISDDHVKVYHLITALTKEIRSLYDNEEQDISNVDFEKAQKYTKAIYDFWADHRSCYGHGQCVFGLQNEERTGFFQKWFSWF